MLGAILIAGLITPPTAAAQTPPARPRTRILILYGHNPNAPGVVQFTQQLKRIVREQVPTGLEIYDENLDLDRFSDLARSRQIADYFADKYRGVRPDVIVAEGTGALRFATERLRHLFPDVPIVYGNAFEPTIDFSALPANVIGRRLSLPFVQTFALAHALQPNAERVVLVVGSAWTDSSVAAEAARQITPLLHGTRLEIYQNWDYEGLVDSLRRVSPGSFVLLADFRKDNRGRDLIAGDLIATLTRAASVPTYGIARNWIGDGIVGGGVMDFADEGSNVGRLVVRVLGRAPNEPWPASEPVAASVVVDWRQLERWHLREDLLPPGTEVLFRPRSLWARYRGVILGVLALLVVQSLLIAWLLVERSRRAGAQRIADETRAQVEHMGRVATVSGLAAAVSHDLGQPLTAIRLNAEAAARLLALTPPAVDEVRTALGEIVSDDRRAAEIIEHFRALFQKHDPINTTVDLNDVCQLTAKLLDHEVAVRRARLVLELDSNAPPVRGDPVQLQQALINLSVNALDALAGATADREIAISTLARNGAVEVRVTDTGPGLPPDVQQRLFEPFFSTKPHGLGMGLTIVRSIVERHHGSLRADNRPEKGARFTMTLPAAAPSSSEIGTEPPRTHIGSRRGPS